MNNRRRNTIQDFHKRFVQGDKSECWIWTGTILSTGHGQFSLSGKRYGAHVLSYKTFNGKIPKGMEIRHTCDNPSCVNPHHLITGTKWDNAQDRKERGRQQDQRGDKAPGSKLKANQIYDIRGRFILGELQKDIAKSFGITRSYVSTVVCKRTWKHI